MWASTSAERNESFIKWSKGLFFCSTPRKDQAQQEKPELGTNTSKAIKRFPEGLQIREPSHSMETDVHLHPGLKIRQISHEDSWSQMALSRWQNRWLNKGWQFFAPKGIHEEAITEP